MRDLALVHRLSESGVVLDAESAAINLPHPLRSALINRLTGGSYQSYIWKHDERISSAFVQLKCDEGCATGRLLFLGTSEDGEGPGEGEINEDLWLPMLDELTAISGKHGLQNLVAEIDENGPELPVFRKAGYAVYTRQDIWIKDETETIDNPLALQELTSVDEWDVYVLYSNIVPRLIQSVEPNPPINNGDNWVLKEGDELAAFVHSNSGTVATWMRLLIHPNASTKPRKIIQAAAATSSATREHPVYCCVRKYQSWLQSPLEDEGFKYWGSQAVMVKHMTQLIKQQSQVHELGLEAQAVPGSSTLIQGFSHTNGNQGRLHDGD